MSATLLKRFDNLDCVVSNMSLQQLCYTVIYGLVRYIGSRLASLANRTSAFDTLLA